jgi:hypothetical protein
MYASQHVEPIWVGQGMGTPKVWPAVIEHLNGYEPGILHQIGGAVWRNEAPYRLSLIEATERAGRLASEAINRTAN